MIRSLPPTQIAYKRLFKTLYEFLVPPHRAQLNTGRSRQQQAETCTLRIHPTHVAK